MPTTSSVHRGEPQPPSDPHRRPRRRVLPVLWISGGLAATALVLGVSGTLSSWTAAIITNGHDTAGATTTVALAETGPDGLGGTATCDTTTSATNTIANCSTIDKYGGDTAMSPGDSSVVDVTFTNTGSADGTFGYAPGACASTAGPGGIDLCSDGDLTVAVACSTGTSYDAASAVAALSQAATAPGSLAAVPSSGTVALAAGDAVTCEFTTTLASAAKAQDAGSAVSQPITWTLTKS